MSGCAIELNLSSNNISGKLPANIGKLVNLEYLNLSNNPITSEFPSELGELTNLKELYISNSRIQGELTEWIATLFKLEILNFSNNNLTGNIPLEIKYLTQIKELYLNNNQFEGRIPNEIGHLKKMYHLNLSNNNLTGNIPLTLGNISYIKHCYLQENDFFGCLPYLENLCQANVNIKSPRLPFKGDYDQVCLGSSQIGAPCDDGNPETIYDYIHDNCACKGDIVSTELLNKNDTQVYPNPFSSSFQIKSDGQTISSVEIYNQMGQVVLGIKNASGISKVDVDHLPNGVYFIKLMSEKDHFLIWKGVKM